MFLWASKANLQPLMPLWNYWPLGPYQQKNKLRINQRAHPGTPINVMPPGSGEDPKLQGTLKNASYRGGWAAN